jgi:hypothetical protein
LEMKMKTVDEIKEDLETAIELSFFELAKLPFLEIEEVQKAEDKIVFRERIMAFCIFGINAEILSVDKANGYKKRLDELLKGKEK